MNRTFSGLLLSMLSLALLGLQPLPDAAPYTLVLGIAQDGGAPQTGTKMHPGWKDAQFRHYAASLAIIDPQNSQRWLIDTTPDFKYQLHLLDEVAPAEKTPGLDGIFLTHAHIGHYLGLALLGHESLGASNVNVFAMPQMTKFLSSNGPWDQLVRYRNIRLHPLQAGVSVPLNGRLSITPITVPHRQEYSEVVAFYIQGPSHSTFYLPDIDSWRAWDLEGVRIEEWIAKVDTAYLDGSFFANGEIPGRDMTGFPHPFISTTMQRLQGLSPEQKSKVRFIHLNHTNPALRPNSAERQRLEAAGFSVSTLLEKRPL